MESYLQIYIPKELADICSLYVGLDLYNLNEIDDSWSDMSRIDNLLFNYTGYSVSGLNYESILTYLKDKQLAVDTYTSECLFCYHTVLEIKVFCKPDTFLLKTSEDSRCFNCQDKCYCQLQDLKQNNQNNLLKITTKCTICNERWLCPKHTARYVNDVYIGCWCLNCFNLIIEGPRLQLASLEKRFLLLENKS